MGNQRCGSGQEILEGALGSRGKVSFPCVVWDFGKDLLSYFSMMSERNGIPFLFFFLLFIYLPAPGQVSLIAQSIKNPLVMQKTWV